MGLWCCHGRSCRGWFRSGRNRGAGGARVSGGQGALQDGAGGKGFGHDELTQVITGAHCGALVVSDGGGVVKLAKAVGQLLVVGQAVGLHAEAIVCNAFLYGCAELVQREAVLVLGNGLRRHGVQAAVVKDDQGFTVHQSLALLCHDRALGKVPVGQVVAGVAQHGYTRKQAGD